LTYNITIGSSLEALQFATQNNTKLVLNDLSFPDKFEASYLHHTWGLIFTKLMLDGKVIGGDTVKTVRVTEDCLQIVCEYNVINKPKYDKLFIFSDKNVVGLEVTQEVDEYKVIDILKSKSLVTPYKYKTLETEENLVKALHIIKDHDKMPIEIYSISSLTKEQLIDFDYSDTMVKFKSEDMLTQNGFVGNVINSTGRAPIELIVVERIVRKQMDRYEEAENIKFIYGN
tara:strand:- start:266 stop:952 length:687 start_codon:yes stop_codon:yes gene_type:complete